MTKSSAITIRLPAPLKQRLQLRAEEEHRSLSGQVVADLEQVVEDAPSPAGGSGRFLGLFDGTLVPSDEDIATARSLLWGRLGHHAESS